MFSRNAPLPFAHTRLSFWKRARSVHHGKSYSRFHPLGFRRHFEIWGQYTLWNDPLWNQKNTRFRCDVVARHRFPKRPPGSLVSFFALFSKKVQKSRSKSGDRMMPASMSNRFIGGSLSDLLQNHASNYQGAPGLSRTSDPFGKKWFIFPEERETDRICKGPNCHSERKERFAQ